VWERKRIERIESKESARENSEDRWTNQVASPRRRYARVLVVVVSVIVKEPFNKPASFKPQLHYLLVTDTRTRDKLVSEEPKHVTLVSQIPKHVIILCVT
jgi:hypothetical protein